MFSLKFPSFKLSSAWRKSLYGDLKIAPIEVPHGEFAIHVHPHLNNINVGLSLDGTADFSGPDWKLHVASLQFSVTTPTLYKGDGLHLLRGEDGEIGISFDKNSTRHFFLLGKAPSLPEFSLQFKVCTV